MEILIGIDGGGTKTACVAAGMEGEPIARSGTGPSNYLKDGLYTARSSLREAIQKVLAGASADVTQVKALCAGLAGVDRPDDRLIMTRVLQEILPHAQILLESDAYVALAGATACRPGVIVVSGTGSIAFGINQRGERARAGGFGHVLGDEGSGYDLARRALVISLRAHDGRGPASVLSEKICRELYLERIDQVIPLLYRGGLTPVNIASLYPLVLEAFEEGDALARSLFDYALEELSMTASAVLHRLGGGERLPVIVAGGVFKSSPRFSSAFESRLKRQHTEVVFQKSLHSPEDGALQVARAAVLGIPVFAAD